MGVPLPRPAALAARLKAPVEEWPYLDEAVLLRTRSRKVCMTCHWIQAPRRRELHPRAHLPAAPGADRSWRALGESLPGLDRRHGAAGGLGTGGGLNGR